MLNLDYLKKSKNGAALVRAKIACEIAEISYKNFRLLIHINPDILIQLSVQMAKWLQTTSEKVGNLAFLDVAGRIAQTLLILIK